MNPTEALEAFEQDLARLQRELNTPERRERLVELRTLLRELPNHVSLSQDDECRREGILGRVTSELEL